MWFTHSLAPEFWYIYRMCIKLWTRWPKKDVVHHQNSEHDWRKPNSKIGFPYCLNNVNERETKQHSTQKKRTDGKSNCRRISMVYYLTTYLLSFYFMTFQLYRYNNNANTIRNYAGPHVVQKWALLHNKLSLSALKFVVDTVFVFVYWSRILNVLC